jgi:hypothetical protein
MGAGCKMAGVGAFEGSDRAEQSQVWQFLEAFWTMLVNMRAILCAARPWHEGRRRGSFHNAALASMVAVAVASLCTSLIAGL